MWRGSLRGAGRGGRGRVSRAPQLSLSFPSSLPQLANAWQHSLPIISGSQQSTVRRPDHTAPSARAPASSPGPLCGRLLAQPLCPHQRVSLPPSPRPALTTPLGSPTPLSTVILASSCSASDFQPVSPPETPPLRAPAPGWLLHAGRVLRVLWTAPRPSAAIESCRAGSPRGPAGV